MLFQISFLLALQNSNIEVNRIGTDSTHANPKLFRLHPAKTPRRRLLLRREVSIERLSRRLN
jgi:hypothetical protein